MNTQRRTTVARSQPNGFQTFGVGRWALDVGRLLRFPFSRLSSSSGRRPSSGVLSGLASGACQGVALGRSLVRRPASSSACRLASGFTLVELLVVIVVIAILMGITFPVSKYAVRRAKAARQEVMLAKIRSALDDYRATYGEYPITPVTNAVGHVTDESKPDAIRHYPDNYLTQCYYTTNSPFTNVYLTSSGTVENIMGYKVDYYKVDYCLTYPLMLKQLDKGARPFYTFPDVTVASMVYRRWGGDVWAQTVRRKGGGKKDLLGLYGAQVNRPKAIDPVSLRQWKYECYDGISYTIKTNTF